MANQDYEIPAEMAESAKRLVGKSITGNGKSIKIVEWVGQNYKMQMPDGSIKETPVMWVLQNVRQNKIKVED